MSSRSSLVNSKSLFPSALAASRSMMKEWAAVAVELFMRVDNNLRNMLLIAIVTCLHQPMVKVQSR